MHLADRRPYPPGVAERATGNDGNEQWPPALAYDAFQANVKQIAGSLLRDPTLIHQGELEQARVATVRDALNLGVVAAQTKASAERSFEDRRAKDEHVRATARQRAAASKRDADHERSQAKQKAAADARARSERDRRQERKREDELARTERAAKAEEIAHERKALAASKRAAATKARTIETDKKLRASKARRAAS